MGDEQGPVTPRSALPAPAAEVYLRIGAKMGPQTLFRGGSPGLRATLPGGTSRDIAGFGTHLSRAVRPSRPPSVGPPVADHPEHRAMRLPELLRKSALLAGVALLAVPAFAERVSQDGDPRRTLVEQFDTDGDGKLNAAEREQARATLKKTRAKQGEKTKQPKTKAAPKQARSRPAEGQRREARKGQRPPAPKTSAPPAGIPEAFRRFDLDANGHLSAAERQAARGFLEEQQAPRTRRSVPGRQAPARDGQSPSARRRPGASNNSRPHPSSQPQLSSEARLAQRRAMVRRVLDSRRAAAAARAEAMRKRIAEAPPAAGKGKGKGKKSGAKKKGKGGKKSAKKRGKSGGGKKRGQAKKKGSKKKGGSGGRGGRGGRGGGRRR